MMFGFNHLVSVAATGGRKGRKERGHGTNVAAKSRPSYCYWGADPFGTSTGTCPHESRREINLLGTLLHERMLLLSNVAFQLFIPRVDQQKPCRGRCKNTYQLHESIMIPSRSCQHTACSYWS